MFCFLNRIQEPTSAPHARTFCSRYIRPYRFLTNLTDVQSGLLTMLTIFTSSFDGSQDSPRCSQRAPAVTSVGSPGRTSHDAADKGTPTSHRTVLKPGLLRPHRGTSAFPACYFSPARAVARQHASLPLDRRSRSSPRLAVAERSESLDSFVPVAVRQPFLLAISHRLAPSLGNKPRSRWIGARGAPPAWRSLFKPVDTPRLLGAMIQTHQ